MTNTRLVPTRVHEDGTQSAEAWSTPHADKCGIEVHCLPRKVIPVVFLPGIMGTHLKLSKERQTEIRKATDISWRPEDTAEAIAMMSNDPAQRQMILDPETTSVDRYNPEEPSADKRHKNVSKIKFISAPLDILEQDDRDRLARQRGWSEVYFDSYGRLLKELEAHLNQMCDDGKLQPEWTDGTYATIGKPPADWAKKDGTPPDAPSLASERLLKICDAWYPVHAVGYNWLRSNGDSAKDVAKRIREEIIEGYKKLGFDCGKVIVVTHSMGGLVARALIHPNYGNAQDIIAGVVHGAMPAIGAAAAYKRMRAGFEGGGIEGYLFKKVVGDTGPKVTAVLANAPGGLQLLPSERYGTDWLKATVEGEKEPSLSLPKADPYAEIYTVENKWYGLINPAWVNPAEEGEGGASLFRTKRYLINARTFHRTVASTYHDHTYLSFGVDDKHKTWGEVEWQVGKAPFFGGGARQHLGLEKLDIAPDAEVWKAAHDDGTGTVRLTDGIDTQLFGASIAPPAEAGDGTVPRRSAQDPVKQGKPKVSFEQQGYEHQASFKDRAVIASTMYGICRIAAEAFDWWET